MEDRPTNAQLGIVIAASCVSIITPAHQTIQRVDEGRGSSQAPIWRRGLNVVSCCAECTLAVLCALAGFLQRFLESSLTNDSVLTWDR